MQGEPTTDASGSPAASHVRSVQRRRVGAPVAFYGATAFLVVSIVFLLPRAMPGDPLLARVDSSDTLFVIDDEGRDRFRAYYGLDEPLLAQYRNYLGSIARGDLGWSIGRSAPVRELIAAHLPWTLLLVGTALALSALIGFFAGIAAAWRRGRAGDRLLLVTLTGTRAMPEYVLGTLLLILLAVVVPAFPLAGARTPFAVHESAVAAVIDVAYHLVLPATALTLGLLGGKFLLVRNTAISALGQDYMELARAKGLPERLLKYRHAGRNALLPFLTVLGIQTGFAVGGAVFVETIFGYPGMGTLILRALDERDYPVLEGSFLVLAGCVLLVNLAVDLTYGRLDPRARAS